MMISPLDGFAVLSQSSLEGIDYIIQGKQRKTCFGDNKNRPRGKRSKHFTNTPLLDRRHYKVVDQYIERKK